MILDISPIAVATCNSSRCVTVSGAREFYIKLLDILLNNSDLTLGDLVFQAKTEVISSYPNNDYFYGPAVLQTILGDPALRIRTLYSGINQNPGNSSADTGVQINYLLSGNRLLLHIPPGSLVNFSLFDLAGRIVKCTQYHQSTYVNIEYLSPGTYLVVCYRLNQNNSPPIYFKFTKIE